LENQMSQKQKLLAHLKTGKHITALEAIGLFGIFRLAARICDLRGDGYEIDTAMKMDGQGRDYARYSLVL
jgi:hypothetical protein